MDIFTILFYQPIYNFLIFFYRLFGENLGIAIIFMALISRLITLPLVLRQQKMTVKSKEMKEKMDAVKQKHKNNKEKETEELMKLQQEYLPGQIAGCLPFIFQLIVLLNINSAITNLVTKGVSTFNQVAYPFVEKFSDTYAINSNFFGIIDFHKKASDFDFSNPQILAYVLLLALVAITQYFSMRISFNQAQAMQPKKERKPGESEDFNEIVQQSTKQTLALFPILTLLIAYNYSAGLSLYWIAQSTFVIIQTALLQRLKKQN
jgi:YidC/Oxa1 family membrane protein insertase